MKYDLSEITAIIRDRRTIYPEQFSERKVQREMVEHMLTNATWAPTHGKTQPWRFKVFMEDGQSSLSKLVETLYLKNTPPEKQNQMKLDRTIQRIQKSSVVIALVMARQPEGKIPEMEEIEAVACAAQNIMLTATAYGLGAYWSSPGFIYEAGSSQDFGYGAADKVLGLMYIGYPSGDWPKSHRKPLEYVTAWIQ